MSEALAARCRNRPTNNPPYTADELAPEEVQHTEEHEPQTQARSH